MSMGAVGGPQGQQHQQVQPQGGGGGGAVQASFGSKVGAFFEKAGAGIRDAFASLADAVSGLRSRIAEAVGTKASPGVYTSAEKRQMLADFRQSPTFHAVQNGAELTKANMASGAEKILASPVAQRAMKDNGLTLTEAVSIFIYTTGDYSKINAQLRKGGMTDDVQAVHDQCVAGMAKLPSHGDTVTRLVNIPVKLADQHLEGAAVTYEAFTSTSTKPNGDETFNGNMFMILAPKAGSAGKDVSMFSNLPDEQEVLFPPGTQFRVLERSEPADATDIVARMQNPHSGKINVTLQEI